MTMVGELLVLVVVAWVVLGLTPMGRVMAGNLIGGVIFGVLRLVPPIVWAMAVAFVAGGILLRQC